MSDQNGYSISFTGMERGLAKYIAPTLVGVGASFDVQSDVIDAN